MMYLWPQSGSMEGMHENFGVMTSQRRGHIPVGVVEGRRFAVDNDAFTNGFNENKFFKYLDLLDPYMDQCLFIVVPDVFGSAKETHELFYKWSDRIRPYGPLAFVSQNGQEELDFPNDFDWLFVGGNYEDNKYLRAKHSIGRAKFLGKSIHVGRVNSIGKFRYLQRLGVDSVDGTNPIYEPSRARRKWTNAVAQLFFSDLIP